MRLVAVSKTFDAEAIAPVLDAGHRVFGENRVQEARAKWPALRERYPGIELHLIGALQSNKAREAVELFDAIHTIDRPRIAEAVAAGDGAAGQARCSSSSRSTPARSRRRPASRRGRPARFCASAARTWGSPSPA